MKPMLHPEKWILLYGNYLLNYAFFRLKDKETAADLVQDTFIAALKSKENYNGTCSEKTWLTIILKNKIVDYYRSKLGKSISNTDSLNDSFGYFFDINDAGEHWNEKAQPKEWNTPEKITINNELSIALKDCVHKMPEKLAVIFTLRYLEETETAIICKDLNISSSNYWVMIHRAKLQLRECLEKNWIRK
jgi:RNA polymerase sigma-70 factor (ECF subfamily)